MGVVLKPHNIEAYEKVIEGFEAKTRVAVVEPPGTGKSFVALKWIEENQDKKTLLLVPSYSIMLQYHEHIKICGYELSDFPNLKIMTYFHLMSQVKNGVVPKVDHIILDEFHRCGAPEWGKGVEALLEQNKTSKVLGLSATPIRYLDKNRDMSDELFDGNVAFKMDLVEAVAREILSFPVYINGIYKLDSDIQSLENTMAKLNNQELKQQLDQKLKLAKQKLEKASNLRELFTCSMKKVDGKYIIFCKDKKHMDRMMEEVSEWFCNVNEHIDIYSVYHENKDNFEVLENFYHSDNSHLKLLFCIDMLNEGFHVPNIDGVIMLRPTISPNLFIQQLGRALAVGNIDTIVYDIVNNVKSTQDMKEFWKQVKAKRKELGLEDLKTIESFEIIEEIREVFDILEEITYMLEIATSKDYRISLVEEFYKQQGRLPKRNETYKGESLGEFLKGIKCGNIILTEQQLKKLTILGFTMEKKQYQLGKDKKIDLVEAFYKENHRLPYCSEHYHNVNIGDFLMRIKHCRTKITEKQLKRLEALGFTFDIKDLEEEKERKIQLIEEFYETFQRLPKQEEIYKSCAIGMFLNNLRFGHINIREQQMKRLINLGFTFEKRDAEAIKETKIVLIEEFYEVNGRLPKQAESYKDYAIGSFLSRVRNRKIGITKSQMERLTRLGVKFEDRKPRPLRDIAKIEAFYDRYDRLPLPGESLKKEKKKVGDILLDIQAGRILITEFQFNKLQQMGATLVRENVQLTSKQYVKK